MPNSCGKCGAEKILYRGSLHCKTCASEYQKDFRRKQKGLPSWKRVERKYALKKRYGITPEEYEKLLISQGGKCLICAVNPENSAIEAHSVLHVDHCHVTGKVRALLCNACNRALGYMRDNPDTALTAYVYLTAWRPEKCPI